jgi:hypothetical protein
MGNEEFPFDASYPLGVTIFSLFVGLVCFFLYQRRHKIRIAALDKGQTPSQSSCDINNIPTAPVRAGADGNAVDIKEAGSLHEYLTALHAEFGQVVAWVSIAIRRSVQSN